MSIAAQRFKFLDKETNVPTIDFSKLNDNSVYNSVDEIVNSAIAEAKENDELIEKVGTDLSELKALLAKANTDVLGALKDALDLAMDAISNLELPDIVKDIFDSLKKLDLGGVKDFVKDLLHVGSTFLCNNLDFLKLFMLGYALNKNIMAGLLTALLLSWLDRYCKGFTQEEMKVSSPLSSLEKIVAPRGVQMTASNTFTNFTQSYASYLRAKSPVSVGTPLPKPDFISNVITGNVKSSISNLRKAEISHTLKKSYLDEIKQQLTQHPSNSVEYKHLLAARGDLTNLPLVHPDRRDKNIKYENLSDRMGTMAKNIKNVDLSTINTFHMTQLEKGLFTKVQDFKTSCTAADVVTRSNESGSFSDFDFQTVMPSISTEEETHLNNLAFDDTSHRVHDMHPTTEVFLQA